jgi:dTDP-4-amino-4,6-dideoxygalactose transaminase
MKVPFFKTTITGEESKYIVQVVSDGESFMHKDFVAKCENWFKENHGTENFFLTKSCTHSLELAALVLNIQKGDEVIMPSYAFVACGNAFALRGATCVFVDIHPDTMNIDETKIEAAITSKTKAIVTLNYSAVGCNYEAIRKIADKHNLFIIEDNAHGIGAKYEGKFLGTFGDISTFSFDHLKNISCAQGGGIAINRNDLLENFFVHYEFGTNRRSFFKGKGDRYEWKNLGSNFPLSELNAAMLFAQLENCKGINVQFLELWNLYCDELSVLKKENRIWFAEPPDNIEHNAHCFYIKTKDDHERGALIKFLSEREINAQFHYTPLHSSEFGATAGRFAGEEVYTVRESKRLLRLPLFYGMKTEEVKYVAEAVKLFYKA